ncbi:MAG: sigma-70 family RNA polymerase sigma factor [Planctomycetes bacterium]|nr:sigma-70 family RNA polymerase sigma factor [Planctomycetota bacterium]
MNQRDLLSRSLAPEDLPDPQRSLELLARAQGGDRQALEDLLARYQDRLRRIVRIQLGAKLRRHCDSMDIVQNTFKAALPKIGDLQPRSAASLLQWLAMIATNQLRDVHDHWTTKKRDAQREVRLDADPNEGELGLDPADPNASPAEHASMREIRELLDDEVAALPDDQRRVVLLRDYCGEEWDHIAAELGRENPHAARQLHQRAWIRLRQALKPKLEREV